MIHRTVMEFCEYYKERYHTKELPQLRIVGRICEMLVDEGKMTVIFTKLPNDITNSIHFHQEASILDEIIALGYPKIPGFHNFMTGEKALVSSRFTGSKGSVASTAEDIWIREILLLITAKIKGGNSVVPIINKKGSVVGIASNLAAGEGNYDDLGYGTAIQITFGK